MDKPELLLELYRLRKKLDEYASKYGSLEEERFDLHLDIDMNTEEKLAVFMDYFAGRPDAIAERHEADGAKHYSFYCRNSSTLVLGAYKPIWQFIYIDSIILTCQTFQILRSRWWA